MAKIIRRAIPIGAIDEFITPPPVRRRLRAAKDALADAVLDVLLIAISRKPILRYETYTHRHCSVR